jgi:tRNA threonylcarbamoyladenosine biosynthesis protein TsaE
MARRAAALGALLLALLAAEPARAHPHVFVEVVPTLIFQKERVVGVVVEWTFDELFSAMIIKDFDADHNGKISPGETAKLQAGAFDNLKQFGWFVHFHVGNANLPAKSVDGFGAQIVKGRLVYTFTARPPSPVNPREVSWNVLFYDETYYVDLRLEKSRPVRASGAEGSRCVPEVDSNPKLPDFAGMFVPEMIHVRCA